MGCWLLENGFCRLLHRHYLTFTGIMAWLSPSFPRWIFSDHIFFEQLKCRTLKCHTQNTVLRQVAASVFFCIITAMNSFNLLTIRFFVSPHMPSLRFLHLKCAFVLSSLFKYLNVFVFHETGEFRELWALAANKFYNQNVKCKMFMTFSLFSKEKQFNFWTHEFNWGIGRLKSQKLWYEIAQSDEVNSTIRRPFKSNEEKKKLI